MARSIRPPLPGDGSRLTVRLPNRMIKDIRADMAKNDYGERQRSRWIAEAIDRLCSVPYFPELVAEDYIGPGQNIAVRISVPASTKSTIELAVEQAKREENLEDVQSKLVRTAIIQRLLSDAHTPNESSS